MADVTLDSNVIGAIAAMRAAEQEAELERLKALRASGARLLITPTILDEIAATYRSQSTLEKLIATVRTACDGLLSLGAHEILGIEALEADPRARVTSAPIIPITELEDLESALQGKDVQKFYEQGGFGNKDLKHLLEALDPVAKAARKELSTFTAYVDDRRRDCLDAIVSCAREKGYLPERDYPHDALWEHGAAWRFAILVYLANEFRRLTRTQQKGEGCLTDLRIVIESAYCAEIKTRDGEFVACGQLASQSAPVPTVSAW